MTVYHLSISDHCIETEAKKEYRRLMDTVFTGEGKTEHIEEKIELIHEFLETSDFPALRGSSQVLAGHRPGQVTLLKEGNSPVTITITEK